MHLLKVKKPFSWAYRNVDVKEHAKGEIIETDDDDLARVAVEEGWAAPHKATASDKQADQSEEKPEVPQS